MGLLLLNLVTALAPGALASTAMPANGLDQPLNTRFTYKATVPAAPSGSKSVRLWIPVPSDNNLQKITNINVVAPVKHELNVENKFGNRMVFLEVPSSSAPVQVTVSFDVARGTGGVSNVDRSSDNTMKYLGPDRLVPVGGEWKERADEVIGTRKSTADKVKAVYEHVVATMQYDYNKESPKLGQGDVAFVCDYKKGNCSDLHSYVISLLRSEGIPAYLEYGFPLTGIPVPQPVPDKGNIGGYHCWTWYYDEAQGWLPLDASDGRRWLDAKQPAIKDVLWKQLVQERSAVAFSRGRDINLVPAQKGAPLNNFIYPYAEADGASVEVKWEVGYEKLSSGDQDDIRRELAELRKMVTQQAEEIRQLKEAKSPTAGSPTAGTQERPPVAAATGEKVSVYGFLRADAIYDSAHMSNAQFPFFVKSPDDPNFGGNEFALHPRLTRLGFNFNSPSKTNGGWDVRGKIELDFQGGGSESRPNPRGRHLYVEAQKGSSTFLVGQTSDIISPLFPSPNDDSLMWNAGNMGDRRPQVRYTFAPANDPFNIAVGLGLTGAVDLKDLDANGVRDGEDSGVPNIQARLGWATRNFSVGFWGHYGRENLVKPIAGEGRFDTHSLGVDWNVRFGANADLRGEAWTGRNLSDFRGGIAQGVNTTSGREIRSYGGWIEAGLNTSPRHRVALGYTLDNPDDDELPAGGRTRNEVFYLHNLFRLGGNLELGFNYLRWNTGYLGMRRGTSDRFNFFTVHRF